MTVPKPGWVAYLDVVSHDRIGSEVVWSGHCSRQIRRPAAQSKRSSSWAELALCLGCTNYSNQPILTLKNINFATSDIKYTLNVNGHVTERRRSFKVSVSTMTIRSVVGVTHLPAIHQAGQLGLQIAVSGPPPLDATELKPSSVTNCLTAIPVGFTPCSMNCSKRLLDAVPYRKRSAAPKAIFCHTDQATCLCHLDRARHVERSFDYEMTICWLIIL